MIMKNLFTLVSCFCFIISLQAQSICDRLTERGIQCPQQLVKTLDTDRTPMNEYRVLAKRRDNWNQSAEEWVQSDSSEYSYPSFPEDQPVTIIEKTYDGFLWNNNLRRNYAYNNLGSTTSRTTQRWDGLDWYFADYDTRSIYEYNTDNKTTLALDQIYMEDDWVNNYRQVYTYNTSTGLLEESIWQFYEETEWVNSSRQRYIDFNEDDQTTTREIDNWTGSDWELTGRTISDYNANGSTTLIFSQDYQNGIWINDTRTIYEYDDQNNRTLTLYQTWDNVADVWEGFYQIIWDFDDDNNLIFGFLQFWNPETDEWENNYQEFYTINELGERGTELGQTWDLEDNLWYNDFIEYYYYEPLMVSTQETDLAQNWVKIAPNPSNGLFNLSLEGNDFNEIQLQLRNSLGQVVWYTNKQVMTNPYNFDLSALPGGWYYLQIDDINRSTVKKLLLTK